MDPSKGSVPAKDAKHGLMGGAESHPTWDWVIVMPWLNFGMAGMVAALSITPVDAFSSPAAQVFWTTAALLALAASMIVWFVRAFTFSLPATDDPLCTLYRRQIFIFAYAFTFISFIVVTMPAPDLFKVQQGSRKLAPITMFYGCFDYGSAYVDTPIPRCDPKEKKPDPKIREHSYAFLLALGGSASEAREKYGDQEVFAVSGGLVLPVYILLVAMIGGAISLSRRIPEIQKRAEPHFPGTAEQSPLQLFEAREQVVFQIMQLIAAPFIAICSFYMIQPKDMSTAVALAFASGFASESILLIIRGIVDGIRPGTPKTIATSHAQKSTVEPAKAHAGTTLTGHVIGNDKAPIANAAVWIDGAPVIKTTSDASGKFALSNVPLGAAVLHGETPDGTRQGSLNLTVTANAKATLILT